MMSPAISVIIPAYNTQAYIESCLDSVTRQSLPARFFEIIVIDDGSSDNTSALVKNYAGTHAHIKLITHDRNQGLSAARNTGIRTATGEFVVFVDSDDMIRRDALEILFNQMNANNSDVVVGDYLYLTNSLCLLGYFTRRLPPYDNNLESFLIGSLRYPAVCILFRRSWLLENNLFFKEGILHEDVLFLSQVVRRAQDITIAHEALYYYIQHNDSLVGAFKYKSANDFIDIWLSIKADEGGLPPQSLVYWEKGLEKMIGTLVHRGKVAKVPMEELAAFFINLADSKPGFKPYLPQTLKTISSRYKAGPIKPTLLKLNKHFYNKVIFYAEVDYHIRNFVSIARALKKLGIDSVILDVSRSPAFRCNRVLPEEELAEFSDVEIMEYPYAGAENLPFTPLCYVFAIDWGYSRNFIHALQLHGVPVVAFYEGISDDDNIETKRAYLPYRLADYLLLPGEYYRSIYAEKKNFVVGMPQLQTLLNQPVAFPNKPLALINLNFTYNVLEDKRDEWLSSIEQACTAAGFDYVISQHPADTGKIDPRRKTDLSVYEALKDSTVLISRFSTCVLEALALGKPAIYHNPHGERMAKFLSNPMDAYQVTSSAEELAEALASVRQAVGEGVDFRANGKNFLQWHANLFSDANCAQESAEAIKQIIAENSTKYYERILQLAFASNFHNPFLNKQKGVDVVRIKDVVRIIKIILRDPHQFKYYSRRAVKWLLFRFSNR